MVNNEKGQAMVEAALVIPVICLGALVTMQIACSCYNAVYLQRMAYTTARDRSAEMTTLPWALRNPLLGRGAIPITTTTTKQVQHWRPFQTLLLPRVETPGKISTIKISSYLLPGGGFTRHLAILKQMGTAEALIEPPIPAED